MLTGLLLVAAVVLDRLLGEPRRSHPLVAFGYLADALERWMNRGQWRQLRGLLAWALAVLPLTLLAWALASLPRIGWLLSVLLLYLAIGLRSLDEHARPVAQALQAGDLAQARTRVGYMVSRQTVELDDIAIAAATTESVLENG